MLNENYWKCEIPDRNWLITTTVSGCLTLENVGDVEYGVHHPMKPFRLKLTHNLIVSYGLLKHLHFYVSPNDQREAPLQINKKYGNSTLPTISST